MPFQVEKKAPVVSKGLNSKKKVINKYSSSLFRLVFLIIIIINLNVTKIINEIKIIKPIVPVSDKISK